jgi:hypothetical protein
VKSENIGEYRRNGMPCSPAIARPGVCQLFVVEFWASNPHRSNRTERDYNRTIVISAAWIEICCAHSSAWHVGSGAFVGHVFERFEL